MLSFVCICVNLGTTVNSFNIKKGTYVVYFSHKTKQTIKERRTILFVSKYKYEVCKLNVKGLMNELKL